MTRTVVTSPAVASSGKPYSPAIRHGDTLYVSGQVAYDPATGGGLEGGIEVQTRRVLDNLVALLHAGGSDPSLVLKTTCLLVDTSRSTRPPAPRSRSLRCRQGSSWRSRRSPR